MSVVVVGSLNCDLVMRVARRPQRGETVIARSFDTFVGGKGNNQALACARAGADVFMVGRVGDDEYGRLIEEKLLASQVRCDHLTHDRATGTGVADIQIDDQGENSIVIAPRANAGLGARDIESAAAVIRGASHLLLQLEIPVATAVNAARVAKDAGVWVVLNPAPAMALEDLSELLSLADWVVPNQSEARHLRGVDVVDLQSATAAARAFDALGIARAIFTMGAGGAVLCERDQEPVHIAPYAIEAVDTTAAGDAFCGALVAALARGDSYADAARFATAAGALACLTLGAEPSLPFKERIDAFISSSSRRA